MKSFRWLIAAALAAWSLSAAALPSVEQVQAEVRQGHYAQAEAMMAEVVAARPGSARAHYVYAEVLAHQRRFDDAAREAASARRLDPALSFTDPATFKAFEDLLERETRLAGSRANPTSTTVPAMAPRDPAPTRGGVPGWVWAAGLAAVAALVFASLRRRAAAPSAPMAPAMGYGAGIGPVATPPAGGGSGLLGVGLAAAGGVAAGMLAERLLDGHRDARDAADPGLGGGYVPGMFDDAGNDAARDLEQRPIDFGNGDGWGGGDVGGGDGGGGDGGW